MKCYRCQKVLSPNDDKCPSCGQAVYTTYSGPGLSMGRRMDGCLPGVPSPKDFLASPNLATLPPKVDLRNHCSPVEDQGQIGSCVACAVVGAVEHQQRKTGKQAIDLSRMFVYFNARRMHGTHDRDSGVMNADGMAAFLAFGAPPETAWPYDPNLISQTPDEAVYSQALSNVPTEYARVDGIERIKGALAQGCAVVYGTNLPMRCYKEAAANGVIPMPTATELDPKNFEGGHAMLLVGYDLNAGQFIVRNSWGPDWGNDKGYCRIGFDTFEATAQKQASWILGTLDSGAFDVVRPARSIKAVEGGVRDLAAKMREEIRGSLTKDLQDSFKDIKARVNPPRNN